MRVSIFYACMCANKSIHSATTIIIINGNARVCVLSPLALLLGNN